MLDQLSQNPSPDPKYAIDYMTDSIYLSNRNTKFKHISKITTKIHVSKIVYNMLPFGSEASWYCHHIPYINDQTQIKIYKTYKNINKFKTFIKIIGKFMILYRITLEKMYNPNSLFVKNCADKYSHIFNLPSNRI